MMRGHKRGCRCVGCSPATRAKGMRALKARARNPLTRSEALVVAKRAQHSLREARGLDGYPSSLVYAGRAAAYRDVVGDFTEKRNPRRASVRSGGYFWSASEPGGPYTLQWFSGDWRRGGVPAYGTKGFTSFLGPFATESAAKTWGKRALVQNPRRPSGRYSPAARAFIGGEVPALVAEGYPPRRAVAASLALARRAGLKVPARNPRLFLPGVPDLVRFGVQRFQVYGARELGLTWTMAGRKDREDVDAWLVRIKHPLAYQAGTAEQRFGAIVKELSATVPARNPKALADIQRAYQQGISDAQTARYYGAHYSGTLENIWLDRFGSRYTPEESRVYRVGFQVGMGRRMRPQQNPLTRTETAAVLQQSRRHLREARALVGQKEPFRQGLASGYADAAYIIARRYGQARAPHYLTRPLVRNPPWPMTRGYRVGDRVTFRDRFGRDRTGRVVFAEPAHLVLNMGGAHGTPQVVRYDQVVKVSAQRNPLMLVNPRGLPRVVATLPASQLEVRYRRHGTHAGDYRHTFKRGVKVYGLADGSVLIRGTKPAWSLQ